MKCTKRIASIAILGSVTSAEDLCAGVVCIDKECNPLTGACETVKGVDESCDASNRCAKDLTCVDEYGVALPIGVDPYVGKAYCRKANVPGKAKPGDICQTFGKRLSQRCEEGLFCVQSLKQQMKQRDDEPFVGICMKSMGPPGCDGESIQGEQGPQGQRGYPGSRGNQGAQGDQGEQGIQGIQGIDGPKGDQGKRGPRGNPGKDGCDGEDGMPGFDGDKGDKGADGIDGRDGCDGEDGKDGRRGSHGQNGKHGQDGQDGEDAKCDAEECGDCKNSVYEVQKYLALMKEMVQEFEENLESE